MSRVFVVTAAIVLLATCSAAQASTYNLATDFSADANPNGVWSYGGKERIEGAPVGAFLLATVAYSGGLPYGGGYFGWNDGLNSAWKNVDGPGSPYGIGIGQVSISSDSSATSTVRWTAPKEGTIDLDGYFGWGDYGVGHRGVFFNNTQQFGETSSPAYSFSTTLAVSTGDFIDLTVWDGGAGGNTPVDATITYVPEPTTMVTLAVGSLSLLLRRKRRA